jgi:hypothetical protein
MTPRPGPTSVVEHAPLTPAEDAIARSVLYAALFDYPLTLAQLRQTLIQSTQTATAILSAVRDSPALAALVWYRDGFFFPAGRTDLIGTRRVREARSWAFLAAHRPLLRLIGALPYVRMVGLSGSIAHMNLENGGDLDLLIVTRGARVWSTAVSVILLARLLGRRRTLCANFVVADTALRFDQPDLFTASQVIHLKPIVGDDVFRRLLEANPFVRAFYPNFHAPDVGRLRLHEPMWLTCLKVAAEVVLAWPSLLAERVCRAAYRAYLRRRAARWSSPEQVVLDDCVLKLHTRSHRNRVLARFDTAVHDTLPESGAAGHRR